MLPLIIILPVIYFIIYTYVKRDNEKMCGLESVFNYKHNRKSTYVEYRQWKFVWGLMIDSQIEVNRIIDEWNDNGYICIGFQRSFLPNVSIIKMLIIIVITTITFGFVSYYVGPTMLFVNENPLMTKTNTQSDDFNERYCIRCGNKLQAGNNFCTECGEKI
jgi:hypothetical protein